MRISNISAFSSYNSNYLQKSSLLKSQKNSDVNASFELMSYPANYYLSFGARVDKGLNRFYSYNKDVMPNTVKNYIESVPVEEREFVHPIEAQRAAFDYLEVCESVEDVKNVYPDESLFSNLIKSTDTKATRGLLYEIRVMNDDIEQAGESVVSTGDDLTLYLLKKLFLEAKTISEINEDLDLDINPFFKKEDKNYISSSTLSALGIKLPKNEYLTSLRYTRDGYSDMMGKTISENWAKLSEEEKLIRIQNTLSAQKALSPEKQAELSRKRSEIMKARWEKLSAAEKVDMIEKMKTGLDEDRLVMINAWNKCEPIREKLSEHFLSANMHNPGNIIYSNKMLSSTMKDLMTEFWAQNLDCAEMLGNAIKKSYVEVQVAKNNGTYEKFIASVIEKQKELRQEMNAKRLVKKEELEQRRKSFEEFKRTYSSMFYFLPKDYLDTYFERAKNLPDDVLRVNTKKYRNQQLTPEEIEIYKKGKTFDIQDEECRQKSEAVRMSLVKVLQNCMLKNSVSYLNPELSELTFKEITSLTIHVLKGQNRAMVDTKNGSLPLEFRKKPKIKAINTEYNKMISPMQPSVVEKLSDALLHECEYTDAQKEELKQKLSSLSGYYAEILNENFSAASMDAKIEEIKLLCPDIPNLGKSLQYKILSSEISKMNQAINSLGLKNGQVNSLFSQTQNELLKLGYKQEDINLLTSVLKNMI